jgi:hypothetical protein
MWEKAWVFMSLGSRFTVKLSVQENRNISLHLQLFQLLLLTLCSQNYLCGLHSLIQVNCPNTK